MGTDRIHDHAHRTHAIGGLVGDRLGDRNLFILSTAMYTLGSFSARFLSADSLIFPDLPRRSAPGL
jgi:hypothetical protein